MSKSAGKADLPQVNVAELPENVQAFVDEFTQRALTVARIHGSQYVREVRAAFAAMGVVIPVTATITVKHKLTVPEGTKDVATWAREQAASLGGEYYSHEEA